MTHCSCETSIIKGTYYNETVIFIALTDPLCDGIDRPTLYCCDGTAIKTFTSSAADQKELTEKVTLDEVSYRCKKQERQFLIFDNSVKSSTLLNLRHFPRCFPQR